MQTPTESQQNYQNQNQANAATQVFDGDIQSMAITPNLSADALIPTEAANLSPRQRHLRHAIGAVLVAGTLVGGALVASIMDRGGQVTSTALNGNEPVATAAPSPTFVPTSELTTIPVTATTAKPVVAPVSTLAPSITEPQAAKPTTTSAPAKEAIKPATERLSTVEINKIAEATAYSGFENYQYDKMAEFPSANGDSNVVLTVHGSEMTISIDKLKAAIKSAEAEAAAKGTITANLRLGPTDPGSDYSFQAGSTNVNGMSMTHYFVASDVALDKLSSPIKGFENASTIVEPYAFGGKGMSLTLLHNRQGEVDEGVTMSDYDLELEARQAYVTYGLSSATEARLDAAHNVDSSKPDMRNIYNPNIANPDWATQKRLLALVGQEIGNGSYALRAAARDDGLSSASYQHRVSITSLSDQYASTGARLLPLPY